MNSNIITKQELLNFVALAESNPQKYCWTVICNVSDKTAKHVKENFNLDIAGYKFVIESNYVKHVIKRHGLLSNDREKIWKSEFSKISKVLHDPDKIESGTVKKMNNAKTLLFKKLIGGTYYYITVFEIRNGKKTLALNSFYKRKKAVK